MAMPTKDQVLTVLKEVYDPEIPFNVVDLGLVYKVDVKEKDKTVDILMTLTAPGCGMGPYMANQAREKLLALPDVEDVNVEITFDPPWNPDRISPEIKATMGIE